MNSANNWSEKEDQALLALYRDRNLGKWTQISQLLYKQHGFKGKTAKKCRERFKNHLAPGINKSQWTPQEETTLMSLQATLGNKWAQISRMIPGRTDDAIKNKFFSKFRKAARNINSLRCQTKNFKIKTLKIPFLYKLINFVDKTSRAQPSPTEELPLLAQNIKNIIIGYEEMDHQKEQTAVRELEDFDRKIQLFCNRLKSRAGKPRGRKVSAAKINTAFQQPSPKNITDQPEIAPFLFASTPKKEEKPLEISIGVSRLRNFNPLPINSRFDEDSYFQKNGFDKAYLQWDEHSQEQYDIWKTPLYRMHHPSPYID